MIMTGASIEIDETRAILWGLHELLVRTSFAPSFEDEGSVGLNLCCCFKVSVCRYGIFR